MDLAPGNARDVPAGGSCAAWSVRCCTARYERLELTDSHVQVVAVGHQTRIREEWPEPGVVRTGRQTGPVAALGREPVSCYRLSFQRPTLPRRSNMGR